MHICVHSGCLRARCDWWLQRQPGSQAGRGLFPNPLLETCSMTWTVSLPSASRAHTVGMIQQSFPGPSGEKHFVFHCII